MNERPDLLLGLLFLLACGWSAAAWYVLPHPLPAALVVMAALSVAIPALALLAWQQALQARRLRQNARFAATIAPHLLETLTPIETPEEADVAPLVEALNGVIARLKDVYQQERDFSAHASHELRTPLSGIKLQAELALRATDDKARAKALRHVLRGVERATHLVEQLLTLSRLAPGKFEGHVKPLLLLRVAQMVVTTLSARAQEKHITMHIAEAGGGRVLGHKDSLSIMLSNLLRNALVYTPAGGRIEILIGAEIDGFVLLRVTDSGPGIQVADRERMLGRFIKSAQADGTGLGLAIVKRIVDLHGGTVSLGSPDSGTGLAVDILLPAAPADAPEDA